MFKFTAVSTPEKSRNASLLSKINHSGYLLITQQDEIVYANRQARHYLGLLSDEKLPFRQTFLSLVTSIYQYASPNAWVGWPKASSVSSVRTLIYSSPHSSSFYQLRIEVLQRLVIDNHPIWIVSMDAIESQETAVSQSIIS
ncbi:hypothetical protein MNBD_CHLOROFLEXI01-4844 [hydrothermal vent metagenome]|uniref:PAS domain-containing protein n=1 Tax=hydrothermal vent metagenome TaxID=652676 RepID=A0A3B0VB14_9ZZZZ